jgi:hypothetical protein
MWLKGTVSQDFRLLVFHESVSPKTLSIQLGPFRIFLKIWGDIRSSRCTTGVIDTGGKWEKSSVIKVLIVLFGHLFEVELTHRHIFPFKFTLRSQQPDIVPIICHRCHWDRWQICRQYRWNLRQFCHQCPWYRWCALNCEYLREFLKKFETVLKGYSSAGGKLIHKKTRSKKSCDTAPVRHVTGNDKDYLRKIPRVVW